MNLTQALLWPLTLPYGAVTYLRARAYHTGLLHQRRIEGVVISVGNLTTGGTGKTGALRPTTGSSARVMASAGR